MKTIVILMDSLNRRFLSCYDKNTWVKTPNIDRLAAKSTLFDKHFVGSAPCMPARHDLLTGRLEFLEHNWSGIQPYDYTLPQALRKLGVFSHMTTDHYHFFHVGGENFPFVFDSWDFIRGQEHDCLVPKIGKQQMKDCYGAYHPQYELNKATFQGEKDYPSPKTFAQGAAFVEKYHKEDDWLLFIDSFDPHEPFDVPEETWETYGDTYEDKLFYWPKYGPSDDLPEHALDHIRKQYAKTLSMSDKWLGKLLDTLDTHGLWEETCVILTTDHGFMLGEHGLMAKNYMPAYNEVYHIPLLVHMPGQTQSEHCDALTQNIDLFPTILEIFGGKTEACPDKLHGKSLLPLLNGEAKAVREAAIYGMFGKQVNITDGKYTYFRSAVRADNAPINLYTAMPTTINHYWDRDHIHDLKDIDCGRFLSWTDYPVLKIKGSNAKLADPTHRFDVRYEIGDHPMLFDIENDYGQEKNLCGGAEEAKMCALLRRALVEHDSPPEQLERLGL